MQKKRNLTLLELMISVALAAILLSTLFGFFYRTLKKQIEGRHLKQIVLQTTLLEHNIKHLLRKAKQVFASSYLTSPQQALFIRTNASVDPEAEFSEEVEHILYLNEKKELWMTSICSSKKERTTLFCEDVDRLVCRYFDLDGKQWMESWQPTKQGLPSMIEMTLVQGRKSTMCTFFLNPSTEPIIYSGP